ncbi:MAG: hypoxanthine phosphoribosyltransferase [Oscillospiraceae bacterium]|nr:hypoxanthine phosphoribosyltransferase [Oscillospiraceae bacterium]
MTGTMQDDIARVLVSEETLQQRVRELGAQITADYCGKKPFFLGVLKGCFVFMADLIRCVDLPCSLDFMVLSSYGGGTSTSGAVEIRKDLTRDIAGMDVIIVEDIIDSGITLHYLREYLSRRNPASIHIVTLLNKPERRRTEIEPDYSGFTIPDAFVVGYGLDYAEEYRNLPYIGVLKPEVYEK